MRANRATWWASLVGVVAALVTLCVAEVVALVVASGSSPLLVVGSWVIDLVPPGFKEIVIQLFGTNDKLVLLVCLGVLVLLLAAAAGIVEYRRSPLGVLILGIVAILAVIAAVTRAAATPIWALPTIVGVVVGVVILRTGATRLRTWQDALASSNRATTVPVAVIGRRSFLSMIVVTGATAIVLGTVARTVNAGRNAANMLRDALKLPKPAVGAPPIPAGAALDIPGIAPLVTPNADFYRIDTALQVPTVDAASWRLKVTGMVEHEIELSFDELLALPLIETYVTLMCVSNEVGGSLIGNAKWLGYPIREILKKAVPLAGADMVLSRSIDGFTASSPLEVLLDEKRDSVLAVGMNDQPLPLEHGFPVRMVVPGLYGYVSATKWVVELNVTRFADATAYWTDRGWSDHGPVKISSRIDVPSYTATVPLGTVKVAGVAWAQHTGISAVEVRIDKDTWMPATLAPAISADTWRQWYFDWSATQTGVHFIEVRATDANGLVQSGTHVATAPNGAEGWNTFTVQVS